MADRFENGFGGLVAVVTGGGTGITLPTGSPVGGSSAAGGSSGGAGEPGGTGTSVTTSSGISVSLVRQPSVQEAGVVTVSVPKETATAGSGFTFPLPAQVAETAAAGSAQIRVTSISGGALPGWLRYVPETKSFVASAVPDGAFPMQVIVIIGGTRTTVVISERNE